jgi:hypothetical protein
VNWLVLEREHRMAEIGSLCAAGFVPGGFIDKAQTLLTFGWSRATWHSRESILCTVDWLLNMERVHRRRLEDRTDRLPALV